jgi:hypothetical protein
MDGEVVLLHDVAREAGQGGPAVAGRVVGYDVLL